MAAQDDDLAHVPNAKKIHKALLTGALKDKYTESTIGVNLAEAFEAFVLGEQMEDEQIAEDFDASNSAEDSFFIAFIQDEDNGFALSIKDQSELQSKFNEIWRDLSDAFHDKLAPKKDEKLYRIILHQVAPQQDYNILMPKHSEDKPGHPMWVKCIDYVLSVQCDSLRPQDSSIKSIDRGTYSVIQIGKQNKNQPLLTYLVDAYNRYRIQKRKRVIRKAIDQNKATGVDVVSPKSNKFVFEKCKGFEVLIGDSYAEQQKREFMESCKASIEVFCRRLVPLPPVSYKPGVGYASIDDSIRDIYLYIFEAYSCVHQYASGQQQTAALPIQIDLVIIPKKSKPATLKQDDEKGGDDESDDEEDEYDADEQQETEPIDDVDVRLKGIQGVVKRGIKTNGAERTMRQAIEALVSDKRNQRVICVINRRRKLKADEDSFYCYQTNRERECHDFESNELLRLHESLVMNLRKCLLPQIGKEKVDVNINRHGGDTLTLSFHVFAADEIRVYLYFDGWGTRFFIEDIKYYLPAFFVDEEEQKLRSLFEKTTEAQKQFASAYEQCKKKCVDPKFEQFYLDLLQGGNACH